MTYNKLLSVVMFLLQTFDTYSTVVLVRREGAIELNPAMAQLLEMGDGVFVAFKLFIASAVFVYFFTVQRVSKTAMILITVLTLL